MIVMHHEPPVTVIWWFLQGVSNRKILLACHQSDAKKTFKQRNLFGVVRCEKGRRSIEIR